MLSKIVRIALLLIIVVSPLLPDANAATASKKLCVNKKGAITIKSTCSKGEKAISPKSFNQLLATVQDIAGPVGPQGVIGPVGPAGPEGSQGVVGVKGPKGTLNLAACRVSTTGYASNFFTTSNPVLYAETYCNPSTEFILEDQYRVNVFPGSEGTDIAIQGRLPYYQTFGSDTREYGVGVYANRINISGSGAYEFLVNAICCPR